MPSLENLDLEPLAKYSQKWDNKYNPVLSKMLACIQIS